MPTIVRWSHRSWFRHDGGVRVYCYICIRLQLVLGLNVDYDARQRLIIYHLLPLPHPPNRHPRPGAHLLCRNCVAFGLQGSDTRPEIISRPGARGVSILADRVGSMAAEGAGLSGVRVDSVCQLSACIRRDAAFVGPGHCEYPRVHSGGAARGMRFRADEMVEGAVHRRGILAPDRGAAVLPEAGVCGV